MLSAALQALKLRRINVFRRQSLSHNPSNRKRRGRGGRSGQRSGQRSGSRGVSYQSALGQYQQGEDPATFWDRSNARLGMEPEGMVNGRRVKAPVEFACAVCGVFVLLDRWPKERQDVRCDSCKNACGSLLTGDDLEIATELAKQRKAGSGRYQGLPEMSEEDLAAVTEMKAMADRMGNGRSGNRKRGGGGGRKRRRGGGGGGGYRSNNNQGGGRSGGGNSGSGGRRRRRRRGGRGGGNGDGQKS